MMSFMIFCKRKKAIEAIKSSKASPSSIVEQLFMVFYAEQPSATIFSQFSLPQLGSADKEKRRREKSQDHHFLQLMTKAK